MLKVKLDNVGKVFNRTWIFKGISKEITSGDSIVVLGSNGSGKSTLLRLLSGSLSPSQGEVVFESYKDIVEEDKVFETVAMAAPYLDLIDEYTLEEHVRFHFQFKRMVDDLELSQVPSLLHLDKDKTKPIKQLSSGMRQRVKLGLAILSDSPLLLLDEPATNLDSSGITWYNELLVKYANERLVVICSNKREEEHQFCDQEIIMENYK